MKNMGRTALKFYTIYSPPEHPDGTVHRYRKVHPFSYGGEDLTIAVYNLLDLTPAGRGDWYARLDYGVGVHWGAYPTP